MHNNVLNRRPTARSDTGESNPLSIYDKIAPCYDCLHRRWLRGAGGTAQAALEGGVRALLTKHSRVLDVGCGTGKFARRLIAEGFPAGQVTLVDASASMLDAVADLPVQRLNASVEHLPFPSHHFDIVTCAWVLETLENPSIAIRELCRMVRPGGAICISFCANVPGANFGEWLLRQTVKLRRTGQFLDLREVVSAFLGAGQFDLTWLPCDGPAAAMIARPPRTDEVAKARGSVKQSIDRC